jgi:hypothetical protein
LACEVALHELDREPPRVFDDVESEADGRWSELGLMVADHALRPGCPWNCVPQRRTALTDLISAAAAKAVANRDLARVAAGPLTEEVSESVAVRLGAARRELLRCTDSARAAGLPLIALHCESTERFRVGPAFERVVAAHAVTPRVRAWRRGLTPARLAPAPDTRLSPTSVLVVLDEADIDALPLARPEADRVVSAMRRQLFTYFAAPFVSETEALSISGAAMRGEAYGLPRCWRPLSIEDAYRDAAPSSVLVRVSLRCDHQGCRVEADLQSALYAFRQDFNGQVTLPMPRASAGSAAWERAVATSPRWRFIPDREHGRDIGGDLDARTRRPERPEPTTEAGVTTELTDFATSRRRIGDTAAATLVQALSTCVDAATPSPDGVEVRVLIEVDGEGLVTRMRATSSDSERALCAEHAFAAYRTTCPEGRAPGAIEIIACSYPAR